MTFLEAAINGARTPDKHPNLPVTPAQLADEAVAALNAGAHAVHMHPKTADGVDSLNAAAARSKEWADTECQPTTVLAARADAPSARAVGFAPYGRSRSRL